jgi:CheY-like chemotaxis protein
MEQRIYRALVVDDEPALREATARALSAESFWCDTASDGREALERYRESRHDLVVTDLRMPGMHGYALAIELLKDEHPPRIVVLTAIAEPSLVRDLFSRGVDDVVSKPVDVRVFATKMASLFERATWRESLLARERHAGPMAPASGHTLVAHIEHTLDQASKPVSAELEKLFQAAATEVSEPPAAMITYLERMFDGAAGEGDRRQSERASLLATITAIPLNGEFVPCGEPFKGAARDASEGGLSLLHTRAIPAEFLALRWTSLGAPGRQINLVMQIQRCQPMGPFYEVAGKFVSPTA